MCLLLLRSTIKLYPKIFIKLTHSGPCCIFLWWSDKYIGLKYLVCIKSKYM